MSAGVGNTVHEFPPLVVMATTPRHPAAKKSAHPLKPTIHPVVVDTKATLLLTMAWPLAVCWGRGIADHVFPPSMERYPAFPSPLTAQQ
jgi:hypothetical protein